MVQIIKKDLAELAKQLATIIDIDQLVKDGIIEKKGSWYKIVDIQLVPKHVIRQITTYKIDNNGNCLIKLPKSWSRPQKTYERMVRKGWQD